GHSAPSRGRPRPRPRSRRPRAAHSRRHRAPRPDPRPAPRRDAGRGGPAGGGGGGRGRPRPGRCGGGPWAGGRAAPPPGPAVGGGGVAAGRFVADAVRPRGRGAEPLRTEDLQWLAPAAVRGAQTPADRMEVLLLVGRYKLTSAILELLDLFESPSQDVRWQGI